MKPGKELEKEPEVIYLEHINRGALFQILSALFKRLKKYWPKLKTLLAKLLPFLQRLYLALKQLLKRIRRNRLQPPTTRRGQAFPLLISKLKEGKHLSPKTPLNLKRLLPYIYIGLAIIIALFGAFTVYRTNSTKIHSQKETQTLEEQLNLAKDLLKNGDLALINKDEKKAKVAFLSAQKSLEGLNLPAKQKEINDLKTEIQRKLDTIDKVFRINNLQPKFSLAGIAAQQIIYTDKLYAFDPAEGSLYLLETVNSQPEMVIKEEALKKSKLFVLSSNEVIALSHSKLYLVNLETRSLSEFKFPANASLPAEIAKIADFSGNLYLLDQKENQIWRVNRRELDLGIPVDFIKETEKAQAFRSMAIDGMVWTLSGESLQSWSKGKLNLTIQLEQVPQGGPLFDNLITSNDFSLYLSDKTQARIAEFKKDGSYSRELFVEGLQKPVKDIFIQLKNKKAYFLTDEGVYIIGL
jgi:hypothetical protein